MTHVLWRASPESHSPPWLGDDPARQKIRGLQLELEEMHISLCIQITDMKSAGPFSNIFTQFLAFSF